MDGGKKCRCCKEWKPSSAFHSDRTRKDGLAQRCKECVKVYQRENKDRLSEYYRKYAKSNPHVGRRKIKRYSDRNKEKVAAKAAVWNAITAGRLPAQSTQRCANPSCSCAAQHYHHWSYDRGNWLSVIPLCAHCHYALHSGDLKIDLPSDYAVTVT